MTGGLTRLTSRAALLPGANIDTDVIMPKQFLKGIDRAGLAQGLFHDLRRDPAFVLNRVAGCEILITGPNFGCGSSREHAVWGLLQYGIRAVIGTSFAGIFADNAANNGLLLITLDPDQYDRLVRDPGTVVIDLEAQAITSGDLNLTFEIEPRRRRAIMLGLDRIAQTLQQADAIRAFEARYHGASPWLYVLR